MEESILKSVRQKLGPSGAYDVFDPQLVDFINMAFGRLHQLGIGPKERFSIVDDTATWSDFGPDDEMKEVRTYVYLQVRLLFDPPQSSTIMSAYNDKIRELEWELNVMFDNTASEEE